MFRSVTFFKRGEYATVETTAADHAQTVDAFMRDGWLIVSVLAPATCEHENQTICRVGRNIAWRCLACGSILPAPEYAGKVLGVSL